MGVAGAVLDIHTFHPEPFKSLPDIRMLAMTLSLWIAPDWLAESIPLKADFQTLLFAIRIYLLLKEYGVDLPSAYLVILNEQRL